MFTINLHIFIFTGQFSVFHEKSLGHFSPNVISSIHCAALTFTYFWKITPITVLIWHFPGSFPSLFDLLFFVPFVNFFLHSPIRYSWCPWPQFMLTEFCLLFSLLLSSVWSYLLLHFLIKTICSNIHIYIPNINLIYEFQIFV